ncbi:MAG TPA: hypothetical protein VGA67_03885 [Candidatus Dojkabacteria bacterium]|jgi:hypothetical protein
MDVTPPEVKTKKLSKAIIFIVIFLLILALVIFIFIIKYSSNDNPENFYPEEESKILEDNICPDEIVFSEEGVIAYINNQRYEVSSGQKDWIEENCPNTVNKSKPNNNSTEPVTWTFNGKEWISSEDAPDCAEPLEISTPVDMSLVSGMLYPGQYRGTDYKPHGGFAFDNQSNNSVIVTLPDDAILWRAVGYIEDERFQYLLDFITPCGIAYRFDHLLTLSPEVQSVMDTLPAPTESSMTHFINPPVEFKKGDILATEVGHPNNVAVDFGVYDLRERNEISLNDVEWAELHNDESEYAFFGICWLDYLEGNDKVVAKEELKARGAYGNEKRISDYCKW